MACVVGQPGYPAAMAIKFDAEELIGELNVVVKTQLPFAGKRAMFQLARTLKESAWPAFATRTFNRQSGSPVPFTSGAGGARGGLLAFADDLTVELRLDRDAPKGQDPARYLAPGEIGGSIYVTRFSRALNARGFMASNFSYAAPWVGGGGFAGQLTAGGKIKPGYYQTVLAGLERGNTPQLTPSGRRSRAAGAAYRFFSVQGGSATSRSAQHLPPGIYRAKGRSEIKLLFSFLQQPPTVPATWSFERFAEQETQKLLPGILRKTLEEALR